MPEATYKQLLLEHGNFVVLTVERQTLSKNNSPTGKNLDKQHQKNLSNQTETTQSSERINKQENNPSTPKPANRQVYSEMAEHANNNQNQQKMLEQEKIEAHDFRKNSLTDLIDVNSFRKNKTGGKKFTQSTSSYTSIIDFETDQVDLTTMKDIVAGMKENSIRKKTTANANIIGKFSQANMIFEDL